MPETQVLPKPDKRSSKKNKHAFKQTYHATGKLQQSMLAAGYSPVVAKQGIAKLPADLALYVERKRARLDKKRALGSAINAEDQENIVRGHLLENVLSGKDNAVRSAEYLGKDKRVSMFTADTQIGIITITPPPALMQAITDRLSMRALPADINGDKHDEPAAE